MDKLITIKAELLVAIADIDALLVKSEKKMTYASAKDIRKLAQYIKLEAQDLRVETSVFFKSQKTNVEK